ncbi:TatD related DNase [Prunus dulcis]|uniref:TatD related DNase n=1 Tax=Prunus dulcis TaxID=3755 RepID=A0A5H2XP17_PRUDU|nr:TatD related DNase [Prunus dulcis]
MARKGFGVKWRGWIFGCLESANFSIMINGKPRGKFRASRGLRQGDPLSPFLFTLVSDVLSRIIERAQDVNLVHGIVSGHDQVEVSHLQFADDTIFFLDGKEEYWLNLLQMLKLFCDVSGMKINKAKSCILGINFSIETLNNMAGSWGCEVGCWPMVYLGLPLGGNPRALNFWNPVLDKVEKRLQNGRGLAYPKVEG